jgi:hypothetical protein
VLIQVIGADVLTHLLGRGKLFQAADCGAPPTNSSRQSFRPKEPRLGGICPDPAWTNFAMMVRISRNLPLYER